MKSRYRKKRASLFLTIILASVIYFQFAPVARAQEIGSVSLDPDPCLVTGPADAAGLAADAAATLTSVPVHDLTANLKLTNIRGLACEQKKAAAALKNKQVGITIFGIPVPGTSWDAIAGVIVRVIIDNIVQSTVTWINNGFEGNPAFVTDPEQYFTDIADGVAGDFIAGSDLNFLCSPFQAQIRIALQKSITRPGRFQCTLTEVVGNIDNFVNDFSEGGWDGWFAMTQNNQNNPYGAYIDAKLELDSRVARAVGLKKEQLDWGSGFLSTSDCLEYEQIGGNSGSEIDTGGSQTGECIRRGPIKTPGVVIASQLENVLGTGIRQLELADDFDTLIGALVGQLLQKTVFSARGLLK